MTFTFTHNNDIMRTYRRAVLFVGTDIFHETLTTIRIPDISIRSSCTFSGQGWRRYMSCYRSLHENYGYPFGAPFSPFEATV
jgi:hypothetical protein